MQSQTYRQRYMYEVTTGWSWWDTVMSLWWVILSVCPTLKSLSNLCRTHYHGETHCASSPWKTVVCGNVHVCALYMRGLSEIVERKQEKRKGWLYCNFVLWKIVLLNAAAKLLTTTKLIFTINFRIIVFLHFFILLTVDSTTDLADGNPANGDPLHLGLDRWSH